MEIREINNPPDVYREYLIDCFKRWKFCIKITSITLTTIIYYSIAVYTYGGINPIIGTVLIAFPFGLLLLCLIIIGCIEWVRECYKNEKEHYQSKFTNFQLETGDKDNQNKDEKL